MRALFTENKIQFSKTQSETCKGSHRTIQHTFSPIDHKRAAEGWLIKASQPKPVLCNSIHSITGFLRSIKEVYITAQSLAEI
ncbi:CLUMA_CG000919, isoform A [Clunio marinus]|uniref:CLUMA_CG000919, isoform A n=1 Tax=Clunio marinus TaxID=568069 RepID=A0A1J1HHN5_9DIPT|nr:CLUMA_CG000919, isoform A [Clunio marinus]